ncbi:MAG: nucleotidyltransferase domain-containing protein [Limnohabitans sp.]|jgi:predicted nucleotidyltransferase
MALSELLFPNRYRRAVLSMLLMNPERRVHLRELARLTGASPGTLKKELDALTEAGLLNVQRVGNQTHFSANAQHPVYPELSGLIRKTTGLHDVLARALEPLADGVVAAFVFGSVASGTEAAHSDVDLMVIGTASFGEVVNAVYEAQAAVGREINPKVMKREEWQAKRSAGQAFLNEVMHKPKLFILGTADDL